MEDPRVALCEVCRAELVDGTVERLPPPWFDHDARTVAGKQLTPKDWQVLEILWRRRHRKVSTDTLMTLLYSGEPDDPPADQIIAVYICRLRAALDPTPYSIQTGWRDGYQLLLHKQSAEPEIGGIEDDQPVPQREQPRARGDKYGLAPLRPGQSRRIGNAKLSTLRGACRDAQRRGYGRFTAGYDDRGDLRIWRVE
jgi:DNA-binding winged helix-turn-helix (wHTH) protein